MFEGGHWVHLPPAPFLADEVKHLAKVDGGGFGWSSEQSVLWACRCTWSSWAEHVEPTSVCQREKRARSQASWLACLWTRCSSKASKRSFSLGSLWELVLHIWSVHSSLWSSVTSDLSCTVDLAWRIQGVSICAPRPNPLPPWFSLWTSPLCPGLLAWKSCLQWSVCLAL